jgi:Na+-driven multidrug efflux pump
VIAPAKGSSAATFTHGSILRHVLVMTVTSGAGLMAIFLIDLMSIFYVSLAHRDDWRAAVGLVSKVLFFPFALNLGMIVAIGTVVSVAIGRGDRELARRSASTGLVLSGSIGLVISLAALPWRVDIVRLFGGQGEALAAASRLLAMMLPVNVFLSIGMGCSAILRACGDPKRALYVSVAGALTTAIADPVFILGLGQGVNGVGAATIISRIAFVGVGLWGAVHVHHMVAAPRFPRLTDVAPIARIAVPAMAANLALPFADWYITQTIWQFGVAAPAAAGVYDRIMPFAFSFILALAGAIGPIIGQNLGAGAIDRVRLVFSRSLVLTAGYGLSAWLIIAASAPYLARAFGLVGDAGTFFDFLCRYATVAWVFVGCMLVSNAVFNTIGYAQTAMLFNWGRATIGTIPFVWLGARFGGAEDVMIGIAAAAVLFAVASVLTADRLTRRLGQRPFPAVPSLEAT